MALNTSTPHLNDSELLHLIDSTASALELDRWSQHALACQECAARLETLRRRALHFAERVSAIELPADFRYPTFPSTARVRRAAFSRTSAGVWLRAAAVFVVLLIPFLTVEPLRAWVGERWAEIAILLGGGETPTAPPTRMAESSSKLWFTPVGERFVVEIESRQAGGSLILRTSEGPEGCLGITSGGGGETALVREQGLRIRNTQGSIASYTVALPRTLSQVKIRIGSDPPLVWSTDQLEVPTVFDLQLQAAQR